MGKIKVVVMFLLPMIILGSEYSLITESSPWGICAVWYNMCEFDEVDPEGNEWRYYYLPKIDSSKSCGLSWIRPNCIPHRADLHPASDDSFYFAPIDSFVRFMQERGMNTLYIGWPRNHYTMFDDDDSTGYYEFYRTLVERYDGDGEGYTVPIEWNSIYYPEPEWLKKPIKYWEICNEPYNWEFPSGGNGKGWPDYRNRKLENFRIYVRQVSRGIHDADSTAKVVAPAITPLQDYWKTPSGTISMTPDSLWWWIIGDNMKNYIDIISVHKYDTNVGNIFYELDSMKNILNSLGADSIPVWVTETGWHTDTFPEGVSEEEQAEKYIEYCDSMLNRPWLKKTTFFALKFGGDTYEKEWGILLPSDSHKIAFDSLQSYIDTNTPKINLKKPKNNYKLALDAPYEIKYDLATDNNTPSNEIGIKIEYSTDGGWNYNVIEDSDSNSGSYIWTPNFTSNNCKLRVIAKDSDSLEGWSANDGFFSIIVDSISPNVNVTSPGQYRVVYEGPFTVKWNASDNCNNGINSQKLYYPYGSENLDGDVRSKEVNLQTSGRGSEEDIKLEATDYKNNTGEDINIAVVIDPSQTNYNLWWSHDANWYVTISTIPLSGGGEPMAIRNPFNRAYKGNANNWQRIDLTYDQNRWTDPNPISEGQTRNYLVCLNDFDSLSDTLTVHRPAQPPPCPILYTFTGDSFEVDNSLLPESEFNHQLTRDYYILKKNPKAIEGAYRFKIIEGVDNTYIDLIKLRLIDHSKGKKLGILPNGETTLFNPSILPVQAIDNKGKDWKDSLLTEGSGYYYGRKGDTLNVKFNKKTDYLYTILAPPKDPVKAQSESGGSTMLYSRMSGSDILISNIDSVILYLPQDSLCRIDYVRKGKPIHNPQITEIEASHIDLPQEVTKEDSIYYHLSPGDTLEFSFKTSEMHPGFTRSYCLEVVGYYLEVGKLLGSPKGGESGSVYETETVYENYIRPSSSIIPGNLILNASSNEEREVEIEVIDRIGRIMKREKVRLTRGKKRIDLGELKTGIYFIKVSFEGEEIYKVTVIR